MSESFEKAVEAAHASVADTFEGRGCTLSHSAVYTMLTAALPHLTAQDVPHAAWEVWFEGWDARAQWSDDIDHRTIPAVERKDNTYAEEADHE